LQQLSGEYLEARRTVESAIALSPRCAKLYAFRGSCHEKLKEYTKASEDFYIAVTYDPANSSFRYSLAETLREIGENDSAIEQYEAALALKHDAFFCHLGIGFAHQKSRQYQKAIAAFNQAKSTNPSEWLSNLCDRAIAQCQAQDNN
jgi:tetratricopeptide (TPR) repeat protein